VRRDIGDKSGTGDVLNDIARFYNDHNQFDKALTLLKQALQIQMDAGNENSEALALGNIGNTYLQKGDYEDARTYFSQALSIREKLNVPTDIADTLHNLAETSTRLGQFNQAVDQYLRALDLRRKANDKRGGAIESASLGVLFGYQGRYGAALSSAQDALKTMRDINEKGQWLGEVLMDYGRAQAQIGRSNDARKSLNEALPILRDAKNDVLVAQALNDQGDSFFYQGDYKSSEPMYQQALLLASKTGDKQMTLLSKVNLTKLAIQQGSAASAVNTLRSLSNDTDTLGLKYLSVECSVYLAEALIQTKNYAKARDELNRALSRSEKLGLHAQLARSQYLLGRALQLSGNAKEAASHFADARRILDDIKKDAGSDSVTKRSDLAPIYAVAAN
jgi:eukaryotic-like serine/threonine-protein kinase